LLTIAVLAMLGAGSTVFAQQPRSVTVTLNEQNASGVAGTAVLTDLGGGRTQVVVDVTPTDGDHPAHIHMGSCENLNPAPEFPLSNVQNGTSTTIVNISLANLQAQQRAINLHLSPVEVATYVACGDIPVVSGTQPVGQANPQPQPAAPTPVVTPLTMVAPMVAPAQLPRTGELDTLGQTVATGGLALFAAGLLLRRRRSRKS